MFKFIILRISALVDLVAPVLTASAGMADPTTDNQNYTI